MVKHYCYFQINIKISANLSSPMPSFAELGVEDIASFCFCNFFFYMEVRVMFDLGLVISVTDVIHYIYSVLASIGLALTLRVCYSCTSHQRDGKFN